MKRLQWQIECLAYGCLEAVVRRLPGAWTFRLGERLADLIWPLLRGRRRSILRNLRIVFGETRSREQIQQLARASFRRSGANLLSVAHTAGLRPEELPGCFEFEGWEVFEQARAEGRGVVILLSHMGNWELLSRLIHQLPDSIPVGAFYRPLNNELLDQRVRKRREADGTRMFSKRDPFHKACRFLRDGGVLGILSDQRVGPQGEVVPFFGRLTRCSPLPSLLARRTRSALLAFSVESLRPGRWRGTFLPVASTTTADAMQALEKAMSRSPEDVFWLQERWRCYLNPGYGLAEWLGDRERTGAKPHRVLLWIGPVETGWSLPTTWLHPDVRYVLVAPPSWSIPAGLSQARRQDAPAVAGLEDWLNGIDQAEALPLDAVVAVAPPERLAKACRALGVGFVELAAEAPAQSA